MPNRSEQNDEHAALVARLDALTERVATLEAAAGARAVAEPAARSDTGPDDEPFWVLEKLKEQSGAGTLLYAGVLELPSGHPIEWQLETDADALLADDWASFAESLVALGHPVRLSLLREVLHGTCTAAELGALDGMGTSGQVYHHLRQLVAAGWLRTVGRGRYEVPAVRVVPLLAVLFASRS
ncbi:ArsR/SmtB family transcription factor [Embleya sp. NBC_00896]|uniref:ArsR/SmtB family transcription factor n=1 Tax=Embleya sp. NBC_00896 TaxID=2975961 RepID=UPI003862D872|nr:helix-turn-helix domain-containing protein [Embleya sp. NBC_00896]